MRRVTSFLRTGRRGRSPILVTPLLALALIAAPALAQDPATYRLQALDGRPFSIESLKGRIVVLDFWASWCVPCRTSFPFFDGLEQQYGRQGVTVVGLTLEDNEDAVTDFLDSVLVGFTIVRDPTGRAGEAFGVVAMPTTFLLDRTGRVVARFEGGGKAAHEKLEAALKTLLAGGTLPPDAGVRVSSSLEATAGLKAWQRGYLADPIMDLDGPASTQLFREHIHASKEGAAGEGGPSGGGCGCN